MVSSVQKFFRQHPVFHHEEFVHSLDKEKRRSINTYKVLLSRAVKQEKIIRIKRGLFASIPLGAETHTYPINPFLIAGSLIKNSILAYHTALAFYNINYSIPFRFLYLTHHPSESLNFRSEIYQSVRFPTALVAAHQEKAFAVEEHFENKTIWVTSLERTLVDSLDRPDLAGGYEEIFKSFEMAPALNLDHVIEYALLLKKATTIAKLGWFLEQQKHVFNIENYHLQQLHAHQPKAPHYIDRRFTNKSKLIKEWNIIVPESLYHRSWEELHD